MAKDNTGLELQENDKVILLVVPEDLVADLPEEEAKFLRESAGKVVTVSEIGDDSVEVTLTDEVSGVIHFLYVSGNELKLV